MTRENGAFSEILHNMSDFEASGMTDRAGTVEPPHATIRWTSEVAGKSASSASPSRCGFIRNKHEKTERALVAF